ncbi:hypothetical protein TNCV_1484091 [Trichonephila clavipes]|nr:hypothetical protein TNCV_1484091 [Trichonephila clavipes]
MDATVKDAVCTLDNGIKISHTHVQQCVPVEWNDLLTCLIDLSAGRSYHRINHTGPQAVVSPTCNYSPTNRAPISKKGP